MILSYTPNIAPNISYWLFMTLYCFVYCYDIFGAWLCSFIMNQGVLIHCASVKLICCKFWSQGNSIFIIFVLILCSSLYSGFSFLLAFVVITIFLVKTNLSLLSHGPVLVLKIKAVAFLGVFPWDWWGNHFCFKENAAYLSENLIFGRKSKFLQENLWRKWRNSYCL